MTASSGLMEKNYRAVIGSCVCKSMVDFVIPYTFDCKILEASPSELPFFKIEILIFLN